MAFGPHLFIEELETNFGIYDPVSEAKSRTRRTSHAWSHQAMKYFIKFQQLAEHVQWARQHAADSLQWTRQCYQRHMFPMRSQTPFSAPNLSKLSMLILGTTRWSYPLNCASRTQKQDQTESDSLQVHTKIWQRFFTSSRRTTTRAYQGKAPLEQKTDHSWPPQKLRKDGKITPQERQCILTTSFCLFWWAPLDTCPEDGPKSTLASSRLSIKDWSRRSLRPPTRTRKKTEQSSRLHTTWGLH